jgi:ankyrin repeat protein
MRLSHTLIALLYGVVAIIPALCRAADAPVLPQRPQMPDTTPPGKPHFDSLGAQVGEQLPSVPVYELDGTAHSLREAWFRIGKPTLLLTSSYTCPKSRSTYPRAAELAAKLEGRVQVAVIYIIEAHPKGDPSPYSGAEDVTIENQRDGVLCRQPSSLPERLILARQFQKRLQVRVPIYVDAMDDSVWKAIGGGPNMGVLVDNKGIVLARQGWFDAKSMQSAAESFLAASSKNDHKTKQSTDFNDFDSSRFASKGDLEKVKAQLAQSPDLVHYVYPYEQRGQGGDRTLLHYAIEGNHADVAALLVEKGAEVNSQTQHSPSPLHLAAKVGSLEITRLLLDRGANVNAKAIGTGPTPLQEALIHRHNEVARLLVKAGASSNFFTDAATGNLSALQKRIDADHSVAQRPDGWERSPLVYAAATAQIDAANLLIKSGARDLAAPDYYDGENVAIYWALHFKDVPMTRVLLEHGSDPNQFDQVIEDGSSELARELLAHKADPKREDIRGYQPLHSAAVYDRVEIASMLIESGADVNCVLGIDRAPCGTGWSDMETPLHIAAQHGSSRIAGLLLAHGAKINVTDVEARTPLHSAAGSYHPPGEVVAAVKLLIEHGANINAKDSDGKTPLDYAITANDGSEKPDPVVIDLLRSHGGKEGKDADGPNGVSVEKSG